MMKAFLQCSGQCLKFKNHHILHTFRVSTWCCDGIANQVDSLDILLFNEGEPIDIMLLQATKQPCPSIGKIIKFYLKMPLVISVLETLGLTRSGPPWTTSGPT